MIRHIWSVLCRSAVTDKETNSLSLFEVFEQLTLLVPITEKGQAPFPFQLVSLWTRPVDQPQTAVCRVTVQAPGGEIVGQPIEQSIDLTSFRRMRTRVAFAAVPIIRAGTYEFVTELKDGDDWRVVSTVPLELEVKASADGIPSAELVTE